MDQETIEKAGVQFVFESYGRTRQVELVRESYHTGGETAVIAYLSDPAGDDYRERWGNVTVNLNSPLQDGSTVLLDINNMTKEFFLKVALLGTPTGAEVHSGFCLYPAFTFFDSIMDNMRDTGGFLAARHTSLSESEADQILDEIICPPCDHVPDPLMDQSVREWYMSAYPEDDLGREIDPSFSFMGARFGIDEGDGFYLALGVGDSLVRERVFEELAGRLGLEYGQVFDAWVQESGLPEGATERNEAGTRGAAIKRL